MTNLNVTTVITTFIASGPRISIYSPVRLPLVESFLFNLQEIHFKYKTQIG